MEAITNCVAFAEATVIECPGFVRVRVRVRVWVRVWVWVRARVKVRVRG